MDRETVEVPKDWFISLLFHAEKVNPRLEDHNLHHLLGYIDSARTIIGKE